MTTNDPPPRRQDSPVFPILPIVTADPPPAKRSQAEKYGGLFYLGTLGLVVVVGLVSWFAWNVWTMRSVWSNVYVLHQESRPEVERIEAAYALSRDTLVNVQQRWDIALRKPLPPLARYLIAESLTTDLVKADPNLFAKIVAESEGWPDWLRLLGVRLMAVAASEGVSLPAEPLDKLAAQEEPSVSVLVDYIRAVSDGGDRSAAARLRATAEAGGPTAELAKILAGAIEVGSLERKTRLESATRWLRTHDPEAAKLWDGWAERDERLVQTRP
jgi:hypothetical protein